MIEDTSPPSTYLVPEHCGGVEDWPTEVEVGVEGHQHGGAGELRLQPAVLTATIRTVGGVQSEGQTLEQFVLQTEGGADQVLGAPLSCQLGSSPRTPLSLQLQISPHSAGVNIGLPSGGYRHPGLCRVLHLQLHQAEVEPFTWIISLGNSKEIKNIFLYRKHLWHSFLGQYTREETFFCN